MTTSSVALSQSKYAGIAQSLLRIFAAGVFMQHGAQKLLGAFAGPGAHHGAGQPLSGLILTAGIIELIGGAFILVGLFTRPVAFIASGEMMVAYFKVHFPQGFWPILNHGELPIVLCFTFLFMAAAGAGPISLDHLIASRRRH